MLRLSSCSLFFFFNDTATTEIYTLSLHDALPICLHFARVYHSIGIIPIITGWLDSCEHMNRHEICRSEEHTSELQSQSNLVCRLLLEKKKNTHDTRTTPKLSCRINCPIRTLSQYM